MRETKHKQIGEHTYHVTQFGARKGRRILLRLLKMVGGAAGAAMVSDSPGFDMRVVGNVVSNLTQAIDEDSFDQLCDTFAGSSCVSGGQYGSKVVAFTEDGVFDLHFAGSYLEMTQWLAFAIEVNFGSFLDMVKAQAAKKAAAAAQVSDSENEDTSKSQSLSTFEKSGPSGE